MTPDNGQKFRFEIPITSTFTSGDLNWGDVSGRYEWVGWGRSVRFPSQADHSIVEYQYFNIIQFNSIQFIDQLRTVKGQQENCT